MDINEIIKYWVSLAEYDLNTVKSMHSAGIYLNTGNTCFQIIEKLVAGYYWKIKKDEPPFDYNLLMLIHELPLKSKLTVEQNEFLDSLEPFSRKTRHPGEQAGFTKDKSMEVISGTEDLYNRIIQLIKME